MASTTDRRISRRALIGGAATAAGAAALPQAAAAAQTPKSTPLSADVIVTGPPSLTALIRYEPDLPALRAQLLQRFPQGSAIKVEAVYHRPFWRDRGLAGQVTSDTGPIKLTFDNSPPDGGETPRVHREELVRGALDSRLLRRLHAAGGAHRLWAVDPQTDRPPALGGGRDLRLLERVHGRGGALGRARGGRSAGGDLSRAATLDEALDG